MKVKQQLVICRPDEFLKGNYTACFNLYSLECNFIPEEWVRCGEIEIDVDVDSGSVIKSVTKAIDAEIKNIRCEMEGKLSILESRKSELLSIEYKK